MSSTIPPTAQVIEQLERDRLKALVTGDIERARSLHADDYELVTPGGATLSKEEYLGDIKSGDLAYSTFEPVGDVRVRLFGSVAAAVRYRARIRIDYDGGHDDDVFWHTDIWELREGRWLAVWSQATRIRVPIES